MSVYRSKTSQQGATIHYPQSKMYYQTSIEHECSLSAISKMDSGMWNW
uniref:Uncharacterized protein n=1 Tax=Anguilla anguilla TaxID=7936 RepID=A0A0E9QN65_ANGAN